MEVKFNEGTPQRPEGDRILDASIVPIDLTAFMEQIKQESSWKDSDRNAITVFKSKTITIVLIALHEGAEMVRHSVNGIASVQVAEGQIKLSTDLEYVEMIKGQMLVIHEGISHSVKAIQESVLLLTITKVYTDQI
ncbi:MAG: hypothetical protein ABIY50_02990 [Ignavibacteria bacterium]